MNPSDSITPPSFDSTKQALKAQALILRETIVALHTHPTSPDFPALASQSVQKMIQLMQSAYFSSLIPLMHSLEHYFKTLQEGMPFKQKHLETLSVLVGELIHLTDNKGDRLEKILHDRQGGFDQLKNKIDQLTQEFKKEHSHLADKAIEKMPDLSPKEYLHHPLSLAKIDQTIVSLFLKELPIQIKAIEKCIITLHTDPQSQSGIISFIQTVQAITQAGKIVQIDSIIELGKAFEGYLNAIKNQRIKWDSQAEEMANSILIFLHEFSHLPADHLDFFMNERVDFLQALIQQLHKAEPFNPAQLSSQEAKEEIKTGNQTVEMTFQEAFFDTTMFDLFDIELETQCKVLNQGLIELERNPKDQKILEALMRAAHSIKGASRVVSLSLIVRLAHAMEDCFVAAQNQKIEIQVEQFDQLLRCVDLLKSLSKVDFKEMNQWLQDYTPLIETLIQAVTVSPQQILPTELKKPIKRGPALTETQSSTPFAAEGLKKTEARKTFQTSFPQDRILRITAQNLNRLMGLAGESLVESRWLSPFGESLQKFKDNLKGLESMVDVLQENLKEEKLNEEAQRGLTDLHHQLNEMREHLSGRLNELDGFIRRHASLSDRLYQEVINSRMRPFADGVEAFPRMVRDLSHQLGKQVKFEIEGKTTLVDRDILEKLEAPLSHLLRNAVDHGIESPEERQAAGKPAEGLIKLEARHRGGMLAITVSDDGKGIDVEQLRHKIVEKNLVSSEIAQRLTDAEVVDFLFLPGFSTSTSVTEISGRGIGLNIVQNAVQEVGGVVHVVRVTGKGMSFHLQLPLTLSVIRALLVEISGEVYALPLARLDQAFLVNREHIEIIENRQFFHYEGQNIGLIAAWQVLELNEPTFTLNRLPVIVLSNRLNRYGLVVDRFIGEKELVVQELDSRLGKIPDINAGALMEDGSPILIIDIEDIILSIDHLLSGGRLAKVVYAKENQELVPARKRILVVDDSITVREVQCRLLQNHGYEVETAVNGVDGWNAVRIGHYDLVITDIDMPRMNGIDLLRAIKKDPKFQHLPVMIVSYKDGQGDRLKGLEAGADYYLTKSSFHDATLIEAVSDLIGNP